MGSKPQTSFFLWLLLGDLSGMLFSTCMMSHILLGLTYMLLRSTPPWTDGTSDASHTPDPSQNPRSLLHQKQGA